MRMRALGVITALLLVAAGRPAGAETRHLHRPFSPEPQVTVPVQTVSGGFMLCVIVPAPSTRSLLGLRKVHAVACAEGSAGEVIVSVLRKNGTLYCSGRGFIDPFNTQCANVTVCGRTDYYCLF
jgi:hypothetical protein